MSVNIRYPNITAQSEKEQITQIKSYLHQLVEQLNYALPTIGSGDGSTQSADKKSTGTYEVQGGEMSYYELRSLIIQELQEVETLFDQLSQKMESEYVKDEDVDQIVRETLAQAKDSGEFDGKDGQDGQDGKTPEKGVDYFTDAEVSSIAVEAAGKISFTLDQDGNLYYEVEEQQ